jgi:hypothetical protein
MNKFSVGVNPTAATETTVFEVPDHQKIVIHQIMMSNHTGNNKTGSLWWQHTHAGSPPVVHDVYIVDDKVFTTAELLNLNDIELVLRQGDTLKVLTEAASSFSVIITFDIFPDNAQLDNFNH